MRLFTINTHHAYLNSNIVIRSLTGSEITIEDKPYGEKYFGKVVSFKLNAGEHELCYSNGNLVQKEKVTIEDAIKLGGSTLKKAFVFDETPWLFVVMKDRMYCHNNKTKEERVEHDLTPDDVEYLTDNYFLLSNNDTEYSVYDVALNKFIIKYPKHIFSNRHLVIYEEKACIYVFDYIQEKIIYKFSNTDKYSIAKNLYYLYIANISSKSFTRLSLIDNSIVEIKPENFTFSKFQMSDQYAIDNDGNSFNYDILDFKELDSDNHPKEALIKSDYHISNFFGNEGPIEINLKDKQYQITDIVKISKSKYIVFQLRTAKEQFRIPFTSLEIANVNKIAYENSGISLGEILNRIHENNTQKGIASSRSGNIYLEIQDNEIYRYSGGWHGEKVLSNYDISSYKQACFSSDGLNVVLKNSDESIKLLGIKVLNELEFQLAGTTVPKSIGFNGYRLLLNLSRSKDPVWIDPITLRPVNKEELSDHIFLSPDRQWEASVLPKIVYENRLTGDELGEKEKIELEQKLRAQFNPAIGSDYDKETIRKRRKYWVLDIMRSQNEELKLHIEQVAKLSCRVYVSVSAAFGATNIMKENCRQNGEEYLGEELEYYITNKFEIRDLIFQKKGYVEYGKRGQVDKSVLIGDDIWFLNYVSFSYDSRYMAIGAKLRPSSLHPQESGVFIIYDIKNNKDILRLPYNDKFAINKDNNNLSETNNELNDLWAVWLTTFSKDGYVAMYDSKPNAYIFDKKGDVFTIENRSILTFSPSGKLLALSRKGYIDFTHHPEENWGHQPCGNVYIYSLEDKKEVAWFHDHGDSIKGIAQVAGNVASASFSPDDKMLMTVGVDGVVVVRNLNL